MLLGKDTISKPVFSKNLWHIKKRYDGKRDSFFISKVMKYVFFERLLTQQLLDIGKESYRIVLQSQLNNELWQQFR